MFKIREANINDIPLIRHLTFKVWPQTYASVLTGEQINYMLDMMYSEFSLINQMTNEGCTFILLYENEIPVGFASFSQTEPRYWKLHKIYILEENQGKGIGKLAINYILAIIKPQNAISLQLQVNRYNKAKFFYEKLGFTVKKIADFEIGNGYFMNDFVMELML
jgi:ribosomal protein S18 acetylase RimI-like enzyme